MRRRCARRRGARHRADHTRGKARVLYGQGAAPVALLSRTQAQQRCKAEYLDLLLPGDILPCRVTHLESFGAFCDIGCGVPALLPIDCMSVSRIQSPADRVHEGQDILCAVKSRDTEGRIVLTMKELLGTWLENAAAFAAGETVVGLVRSVEPYGVFVELAPNLAGLAEAAPGLDCGQLVSVYIKSIIPEKMKIKLVVLHAMRDETFAFPLEYRLHAGHIGRWIYSVPGAAVRATLAAQQFARKEAQHHAQITPAASGTGYNVQCSIRDMESDVFSFSLYVPDKLTAKLARAQFIENGDGIYKLMLAALTSNDALVAELLKKSTNL